MHWDQITTKLTMMLPACAGILLADTVPVRYAEGLMHGFLVVRTLDGKTLADGQMMREAHGDHVTARLIFRFKDGSIYEDTTIFSQRGAFRLLSGHVIQKGPTFKQPADTFINASTGQVKVRYTENKGNEKGLLFTLMKDVKPSDPRTTVSMLAITPKPRLIRLLILPHGEEPFTIGSFRHKSHA